MGRAGAAHLGGVEALARLGLQAQNVLDKEAVGVVPGQEHILDHAEDALLLELERLRVHHRRVDQIQPQRVCAVLLQNVRRILRQHNLIIWSCEDSVEDLASSLKVLEHFQLGAAHKCRLALSCTCMTLMATESFRDIVALQEGRKGADMHDMQGDAMQSNVRAGRTCVVEHWHKDGSQGSFSAACSSSCRRRRGRARCKPGF